MQTYDVIVIGAGVIGASVAFHLAQLGANRVLVLDRTQIGAGTTSQSSGILRTHYSVRENVVLAQAAMRAFDDFAGYLGDAEAEAGTAQLKWLQSGQQETVTQSDLVSQPEAWRTKLQAGG